MSGIVEPPTEEVNNAFKAVEDAKQGMDTKLNEAKKYQSEQIPAANAKADKAARDAEAYRQQRISEAEGALLKIHPLLQPNVQMFPVFSPLSLLHRYP